jgi:hypothetical protein
MQFRPIRGSKKHGIQLALSTVGFTLILKTMKLRYLIFALLTLMTATAIPAQTMTATTAAAKAKKARSVYRDLRSRKVHKAATTVLTDKDVSRHIRMDKDVQSRLTDPNLVSNLRKAKAEVRRDPVGFAEKNAQKVRDLKKHRPKWLFQKHKKRSSRKK